MIIEAVLKCDVDGTPYRIYINDELMTERFYTITSKNTISNNLKVELDYATDYKVIVENLSNAEVRLEDYSVRKI